MSKDREQGQVTAQICELSEVLNEMDDTISQLESRLDSVLCRREVRPAELNCKGLIHGHQWITYRKTSNSK